MAFQIVIAVVTVIVIPLVTILWKRSRSDPIKKFYTPNPPTDTVILHQYGKASTVPSISPFVMKMETYLRVAKIPYVNKHSRQPGPKGKLPWIQYNEKVMADSNFSMEFLNAERKVDLNKKLTPEQRALGHLIKRTVEDCLYWAMLTVRLVFETKGTVYRKLGLPSFIIWYMRRAAKPRLWSHGIGRHSQQEVMQILEDDLRAVSQLLGQKKFLFGNNVDDVCEYDCALFGQLCELVWQMPDSSIEELIAEKYPNLVRYCERMKTAFWPDWDERLLHHAEKSIIKDESRNREDEITDSKTAPVFVGPVPPEAKNKSTSGIPVSKATVKTEGVKSQPVNSSVVKEHMNGGTSSTTTTTTSSSTTSTFVREVQRQNDVVTSRSSKLSASSILQDKSAILPAP